MNNFQYKILKFFFLEKIEAQGKWLGQWFMCVSATGQPYLLTFSYMSYASELYNHHIILPL
jgi:hypothetical protein